MQLTVSDEKMKELMKEIITELISEKRELFYELIVDAIEDVGLARAIEEGRCDDFVSQDQIMRILEG